MSSKLTIKHRNDIIDVVLAFLLLTLNIIKLFSSVSIIEFEQITVSWVFSQFYKEKERRKYAQRLKF